ncbi:MAG: hypothetical protein R3F56_18095 [Planctomycetota bacterium]
MAPPQTQDEDPSLTQDDPVPSTPEASGDAWSDIFARIRARFPSASDGVLFCIHKLQQDPDLKLRDFKDEAALHRVPLSGRSFHSARVLLGLEKPTPPRARPTQPDIPPVAPSVMPPARQPATRSAPPAHEPAFDSADVVAEESPAIAALRRFQEERAAELERLREGVRRALEIIDAALS